MLTQDEKLDMLVEVEDTIRRLRRWRDALAKSIGRDEASFRKIMDSIHAEEDARPVVAPAATHEYAPPQHVAPFCAVDEPPGQPL